MFDHSSENHDDHKTRLHWLHDHVSLIKMGYLSRVARRFMPDGDWHIDRTAREVIEDARNDAHSKSKSGREEITSSRGEAPILYLTFDDGPDPECTPRLLEIMEELGIKATFFLLGSRAAKYPELVHQINAQGHTIGNHSFSHPFMPALSIKQISREIHETNTRLQEVIETPPVLFRPPYGILDKRCSDALKEVEMRTVYWSVVPEDWNHIGANRVVHRVMRGIAAGRLIVLHENELLYKQTTQSTREIIKRCKSLGFQFEAVPKS